ncbi:hypothetical protein GGX14DRAFT_392497 [Mycena pura]|uniref:Uncharacterized protein n=1 Tax=Mycena pura TaxID=153505 RepID=A0AAD6VRM6_9AGAR|nr:hypothetical protein GGX14DRAFT_392497 [Mycena pura]
MCETCDQKGTTSNQAFGRQKQAKHSADAVELTSTERIAKVGLFNHSTEAMHNILLIHQKDNQTRFGIPLRSSNGGYDYWSIAYQIDGGGGYSVMSKSCDLTADDDYNNGGSLWFRVKDGTFYIDTRSSSCSTSMAKDSKPPFRGTAIFMATDHEGSIAENIYGRVIKRKEGYQQSAYFSADTAFGALSADLYVERMLAWARLVSRARLQARGPAEPVGELGPGLKPGLEFQKARAQPSPITGSRSDAVPIWEFDPSARLG